MNTRARVNAIPMIMMASLGLANIEKMLARQHHAHATLQPTGFEEVNLAIEESGVTGMPESITAGRYLVKLTGPESSEMSHTGAVFAQLPEGVSAESAYEDVLANPNDMPSWYLDTHFGGGVILDQGNESWSVLDFTPGKWVVTTTFGTTLGIEFEVTGEMPEDLPDVESNATLDLLEMSIHFAAGELVKGDNVVTVHNAGAQLHFVNIDRAPDGTTREQVQALLDSFMTGTPPAEDGLQEDDFTAVAYIADISPGVSETVPLNLEAGTYFLACWVPDTESFAPHAMMGMWDVVDVS